MCSENEGPHTFQNLNKTPVQVKTYVVKVKTLKDSPHNFF